MFNDVPWRDEVIDHPLDVQDGALQLSRRPGLGVEFTPERAGLVDEIDEGPAYDHPMFHRSDGSFTNW